MKKVLFMISAIIVLLISSLTVFALEGDGTEESPFLITDQAELELVTDFYDSHFKLANDIELDGVWIPLCKQTSNGRFNGVFDGAGHTISNLLTDGSEGGLFRTNYGTIKNLNVVIADDGLTGSGGIAYYNYGTISDCAVKGDISCVYQYTGGICSYNGKAVHNCKFEGSVESTYGSSYVGGITGNNDSSGIISKCVSKSTLTSKKYVGGICGYNLNKISDCYFIGNLNGSASYNGGIVGYNAYYKPYSTIHCGVIIDCYAAASFESVTNVYGIAYKYSGSTITTSYYDKTISGMTDTSSGTPKSTAAMKMKQTYENDWDFETIWGINKNINDGYPYLLWEYDSVEQEKPYIVNSAKITDLSGNELAEIPNGSFYFEIDVTKNNASKESDCLIIAVYDDNDTLIDLKYMKGLYNQNQTMTFGTMINSIDNKIGNIKGFVWNSISGMIPLSNSITCFE